MKSFMGDNQYLELHTEAIKIHCSLQNSSITWEYLGATITALLHTGSTGSFWTSSRGILCRICAKVGEDQDIKDSKGLAIQEGCIIGI